MNNVFLTGLFLMGINTLLAEWHPIGNADFVLNSDQQIVVNCGDLHLQLTPFEDDMVRVRVTRGSITTDRGSWAIAKQRWNLPKHDFKEDAKSITISLKELVVRISKSPVRISFQTPGGDIINQDDPSKGMAVDGDQVRVWKSMPEKELYYGFGEKTGMLERRGLAMSNWNSDIPAYTPGTDPVYQSIPFFLGMKEGKFYGIFFDNTYRTSFDMGKESDKYFSFGADNGAIDYYFFYGPSPKKVIERFTELTGRMNLPPKWALGYQQCRWSYYPESKVRDIAANFRKRGIPCDVIYLDIDYMDGFRCFTWNNENFPNPKKLVSDLAKDGFKIVTIIDPGIKKDTAYWVYKEGSKGNHFVRNADSSVFIGPVWPGNCAFPDFANSSARTWWGGLYKDLVNTGIKGFWNDMNEPSVFDIPTKTFPLDARHNVDGVMATHAEFHNVYGMEMARGTFEGLRRLSPNERPFVLTRAGYAGTQRYSAAWTGDNASTWEHLAMAIPMCLNFGLSGQPFVGPDIGGFIGTPTGEMYTRWLQYGVFLPLCRSHAVRGSIDKEPWAYGEQYEKINKKFIELRYQLMPFLYTEFYKASTSGVPIMRPLMMEFPEDKTTYKIDTQFMVGDHILVSPVVEPGSTSRWMYLPAGEWFDFWTRKKVEGGKWMQAEAPLDRLPVFVRAGAVIPMQQVVQYSDQAPADPLTYEIFPSSEAKGICYEDDGNGFEYTSGKYRMVEIKAEVENGVVTVVRSAAEGSYGIPNSSIVFAINGTKEKPAAVSLRGKKIPEVSSLAGLKEGWVFDPSLMRLAVKTTDSQEEIQLSVR